MTNRRKFLKAGVLTSLSATLAPNVTMQAAPVVDTKKLALKHWVWSSAKYPDKYADLK